MSEGYEERTWRQFIIASEESEASSKVFLFLNLVDYQHDGNAE